MPRRTFPNGTIFAESAPELTDPDASWPQGYESGAGKQPPEAGVHNYEFKRLDEMAQHVEQNGVPRWDAATSYALGGWCLGSDGMLYRAKLANSNQNPVGGDGTYWRSLASITAEKMYPPLSAIMRPTDPGLPENAGGLGFGTWVDMAGRSPMGAGSYIDGSGYGRTIGVGNSYGAYEHQLTISELPNDPAEIQAWRATKSDPTGGVYAIAGDSGAGGAQQDNLESEPLGDGDAHNNLHPVFGVKIWYRTA